MFSFVWILFCPAASGNHLLFCCCFPSNVTSEFKWFQHCLIQLLPEIFITTCTNCAFCCFCLQSDFIITGLILNLSFGISPWEISRPVFQRNVWAGFLFISQNDSVCEPEHCYMQPSNMFATGRTQ